MSDYLNHLVARTLSPEAGVRPQLRSAFEPVPLHGGFTLPADLEPDTLFESTSPASLTLTAPTPFERVPSRESPNAAPTISPAPDESPRQVVPPPIPSSIRGDMPPLEPNENEDIANVQPIQPTDHEPSMKLTRLQRVMPDSALENSQAVPTPAVTPRRESFPAPRHLRAAPTSDTVHAAAAVLPPQTVASEEQRSERIALVATRSVAPASSVILTSRSPAPTSDARHPAAAVIRGQTVKPEPRSKRFAVAAIRPVTPAAPVFSPSLPPAVAPPPPTIHVTIGRVEVRATPPPAGSRAKATLPPVMSLEEYLGRRATGGQR